jgi:hypothetical protein
MQLVHTLKLFICDPRDPDFELYCVSKDYYIWFASRLLREVIQALPGLVQVEFDGTSAVERHGELVTNLLQEVRDSGKKVLWGPTRGWKDDDLASERL